MQGGRQELHALSDLIGLSLPIALEKELDSCAVAMNLDFAADKEGLEG
jgi:hypothetical protein